MEPNHPEMVYRLVEALPPASDGTANRKVWAECATPDLAAEAKVTLLKQHPELLGCVAIAAEPSTPGLRARPVVNFF